MNYESRNTNYLTRRVPVIIRLDGAHFHTFTKGCDKPFDEDIIKTMQGATRYLVENIQGAKAGYEISILLTDYDRLETEAWFNYRQNKMESISAAMASVRFTLDYQNETMDSSKEAHFDSRAFNIPKEEVINYFRWRYQDWLRNSIQMLAQSLYSQKELHGKKNDALHEMCWQKGFNWAKQPGECKNGTLFTKTSEGIVKHTEFNLMDDDFCQKIFGEFI
jgi:tRNA(His) 5'-end guanylyltransferase